MTFNDVRELISDEEIVNELIQYLSSDQLNDFTETLIANYDIVNNEVDDIYDWYHENFDADEYNDVTSCVFDNCDYCAEAHQLSEDDLLACARYDKITEALEHDFDIQITDTKANVQDFIESILMNIFETDKEAFLM